MKWLERKASAAKTPASDFGTVRANWIELQTRRRQALELILDAKKYPYPYDPNQQKVQAEVDRLIAAVREIWSPPIREDQVSTMDRKSFEAMNRQLEALGAGRWDSSREIERAINKFLAIRTFAPARDRRTEDLHAHNRSILEENARAKTPSTRLELEQVLLTNEYRIMMGNKALRLDARLVRAAQGHSQFMEKTGQIADRIPGHPEGASPSARAQKYGFRQPVGENIAVVRDTAMATIKPWTLSSGHHRNLLRAGWRRVGSGQSGKCWTQMLGWGDSR